MKEIYIHSYRAAMTRHSSLLTILRNWPAALERTLQGVFGQRRYRAILIEVERIRHNELHLRTLVYETALECIVNEQSRAHSAQGTGPLYHLIPQRSAASNDSGRRRYSKWRVPPMPTYALARIRMDPL
jgi:hypothetical protein